MVIFEQAAHSIKGFLKLTGLNAHAQSMILRLVLCFMVHRGKMSCSQAAGMVATSVKHRADVTRFLGRGRWRSRDFNAPLRAAALQCESRKGPFVLIVDATLTSQQGKLTENTFSVQNRKARHSQKKRCGKRKYASKKCHSFTFGLLITPSGIRIPYQVPFLTEAYCKEHKLQRMTTAQAAAHMIDTLPLPAQAEVIVLGDTAYDADIVRQGCERRGYTWIFPANASRVFAGAQGKRPTLRSRLQDWSKLSLKTIRLKTIRLKASQGSFVHYRRVSKYRLGPKLKGRVYYAYEETRDVHRIGSVRIVYSARKENLKQATADDVKILLTNAKGRSLSEILELYALRWQIELFFKEMKSTLGLAHYSFQSFGAVLGWVETAMTCFLYLEYQRAKRVQSRSLSQAEREWWSRQRTHGLSQALQTSIKQQELKYIYQRLKTSGGLQKIKTAMLAALPAEYRVAT